MAKKIIKLAENAEMTLEEAKIWRASLPVPEKKRSEKEKRNAFKIFWAKEKKKYNKAKNLEEVVWLHLKAMKMDEPERFDEGLAHFGLKKVK
jgi:hypothetical protein